jgi:hypothetical protein
VCLCCHIQEHTRTQAQLLRDAVAAITRAEEGEEGETHMNISDFITTEENNSNSMSSTREEGDVDEREEEAEVDAEPKVCSPS